jgi:hypothetical protein
LCILFDDVRGDIETLGQRQLEIIEDILSISNAEQHIVCPTYYSFDPVLEKVFGKMPAGYLEFLGERLPEDIAVFWTGKQVISSDYGAADLAEISSLLKRKPILWDNYPVNDGRITSNHLHLQPYKGRPYEIEQWARGHLVNPMNQPLLSQLVLQSLQAVYQQQSGYNYSAALERGLLSIGHDNLASKIKSDLALFQTEGLTKLSASDCLQMAHQYQSFNHPVADEVADWLNGGYRFDPECLTE